MGSQNSKVQYIMLPGQSGKTRKVEELIRQYSDMSRITNGCDENDINIIFCSNNRALVKQTEARMKQNLFVDDEERDSNTDVSSLSTEDENSDAIIENRVFSWFSGKTIKKISKEQIAFDILDDKISMMICCANKPRMKYVFDIVKRLQESRHFARKIYFWLDEGDAYVNLWRETSIDVTQFSKVAKVTPVSATFDSCIKHFGRLKIIPFECTTNVETYHQFQDCNIITDNTSGSAPEYFSAILEKNCEQICQPGVRLFCPGDNKTVTHDEIALEALLNGFVVAILNGKQKALLFPDGRQPLPLLENWDENETPEEIGMKIGRLYRDMNLSEFPFAITGHTCLSRGITFQNELFMFDYGIIPNICNAATAYQASCRMNGNIRKYSGYKAPTVFMCSRMKDKVIHNEEIAINLARICHEEGLQDVGKEEFNQAAGVCDRETAADPKKNVPIVLSMPLAWIKRIHQSKPEEKQRILRQNLKDYLEDNRQEVLSQRIDTFEVGQITRPQTEGSRKRNIDDPVNAANNNRVYSLNVKDKTKNMWQAVLDDIGERVIFMIYCSK
jgi:hypothetical protein